MPTNEDTHKALQMDKTKVKKRLPSMKSQPSLHHLPLLKQMFRLQSRTIQRAIPRTQLLPTALNLQ